MYNHFRTLLLNLSYAGNANEHIPVSFVAKTLPTKLGYIYKVLFPTVTSRYYKMFLMDNYLKVVNSAGREADLLTYDPRIIHSLKDEFFKINRYSNPAVSDPTYPLFVYGNYNEVTRNQYFYDSFLITQIGNTNNVLIYSQINNIYINGANTSTNGTSDMYVPVIFANGNVSNIINIGNTGMSFAIGSSDDFGTTASKTWQFLVEAPYIFDFNNIVSNLKKLDAISIIKAFNPKVDVTTYTNLWDQHPNAVYKLAGLLLAYVAKINSI